MRKFFLISTILLLLLLLSIFLFQSPIPLSTSSDLNNLEENTLVSLSGSVISEKVSRYDKELTLENFPNLTISLPKKSPSYLNKNISLIGKIDRYQKIKIKVLKIISNNI